MRASHRAERPRFRDTYLALAVSRDASILVPLAATLLLVPSIWFAYLAAQRLAQGPEATPAPAVAVAPANPGFTVPGPKAPAPVPVLPETPSTTPPPIMRVSLPAGTAVTVELAEVIATDRNVQGDTFQARLAEDVVSEGRVVARVLATVGGRIVELRNGTRDEPPMLALAVESVQRTAGPLAVSTEPLKIQGEPQSRLKRILKGAGGVVVGVIVGKKAGGTRGAVMGGGVGVASVLMTGDRVVLPEGMRIQFRLARSVEATVAR